MVTRNCVACDEAENEINARAICPAQILTATDDDRLDAFVAAAAFRASVFRTIGSGFTNLTENVFFSSLSLSYFGNTLRTDAEVFPTCHKINATEGDNASEFNYLVRMRISVGFIWGSWCASGPNALM